MIRSEADTVAQVTTGLVPDSHAPDPHGTHLLAIADGPDGYARLSRALSVGHLAGEKGAPQFAFDDLATALAGHAWVLTGCRKGAVPAALMADGPAAARRELQRLVEAFGRDRVLVELWDHGDPLDSARNDALAEIAHREGVECVATNNVHYATPSQRQLASALAAVRATAQPRRDRPVAPGGIGRPSPFGGRAAAPVPPLSRVWSSGPPRSAGPRRSTWRSSPPTCRRSPARPGR